VSVEAVQVYVVVPPRLLLLDIAGPLEVLRRANQVQSSVKFEVHYVGPESCLQSSIGMWVSNIDPLPNALPPAALVVVAGDVDEVMSCGGPQGERPHLADGTADAAIVAWLRSTVRPGHKLITICSGALPAARAGLLDGHTCTTHYSCCTQLAKTAPRATVLDNRLYVQDGDCYSSAGITTGIDLMLHIVSQYTDPASVVAIARYLVVYLRRNGAEPQLSPWLEGRNHIHPAVHRAQDAIAANLTGAWGLARLAKIAGLSERHLSRLFHVHVGCSIVDYINRLRVLRARELLSQTRLDIERVAEGAGFASSRQLRRVWRKLYTTTPSQTRDETARHLGSSRGRAKTLGQRPH
jgi:transcriptional regulator GlxA family with amidase domain